MGRLFHIAHTHPSGGSRTLAYLNGRPSAKITFNMPDIWQTKPDSYTVTIKQNVRFQVGIYPEKCQLDQIQNGPLSAIITFNMLDTWQTVPDS